ncbi:hypothetical protein [Herbaspirillum lusitanum]|uniref:hypothetical protein n=1 Tax=Herbaspirillum lusitanum TaxID=213312 RepID=UPI00138A0549|nr:hypothetical protein [Herbaspirillum lusitanum]
MPGVSSQSLTATGYSPLEIIMTPSRCQQRCVCSPRKYIFPLPQHQENSDFAVINTAQPLLVGPARQWQSGTF